MRDTPTALYKAFRSLDRLSPAIAAPTRAVQVNVAGVADRRAFPARAWGLADDSGGSSRSAEPGS